MVQWLFFPKSDPATQHALAVVAAFENVASEIDSATKELSSNEVLAIVAPHLMQAGFKVEAGKKADEKISVPVLFGLNGKLEKSFDPTPTTRPVALSSRWRQAAAL